MPRGKVDAQKPARTISLHLGSSFPSAWEQVALPWFERNALSSLNGSEVAVITPSRGQADFYRRRLLERGTSLLGLKFFTPPQLREFLLVESGLKLALREHLRLLLATAAEEVALQNGNNESETSVARSVAREPDNFLRALDQLGSAGCDFSAVDHPVLSDIATRFEKRVHDCGFILAHEADRLLAKNKHQEEGFTDLLVIGFDGAHWPLWPLLRGTILRSQSATIVLSDPRDQARDLDEAWVGTWEEHFGEAVPIPAQSGEKRSFVDLTESLDSASAVDARRKKPAPDIHFLLGRDSSEQARAVATLAVSFLSEPQCESIGILLPGPGALARLVARALEKLGIPHHDSIAHSMRGTFDDEEWRAWLELQQRPQLGPLRRFLSHSDTAAGFFSQPLNHVENALRRAFGDILINDVSVLTEYCRRREADERFAGIADGLGAVRLLPERMEFGEFLKKTLTIFRELRWRERAADLERKARGWISALKEPISRPHFLRWLTEIFAETALSRDPQGDHPYASVELLRYDRAENGAWSHLILAGLNEAIWPKRDDESPFFGDEQVAALNAQLRGLNQGAKTEGRFGAGQTIVREGAALCLGARDRHQLALRQLWNAIESTERKIAVAAQLYNTSPREQAVNPSEFFARLYFNARGVALSQREIASIHQQTLEWLNRSDSGSAPITSAAVEQTSIAYRARRRPEQPAGEYDFAFRKNLRPADPISLSATEAAKLFTTPALVWMKSFLRVESGQTDGVSWNLATGQWVHRWLAFAGDQSIDKLFISKPPAAEIAERVSRAADDFREQAAAILSAISSAGNHRALPDWWISGWRNAHYVAGRFAEELGEVKDWPEIGTEWPLDSRQSIAIDDLHQLRVRGRVDLLLTRGESKELWIVDYKTGMADPLKSHRSVLRKQLMEGNGIQICIYALAFRQAGWREVYASLLTRENDLSVPQLNLTDIIDQNEIWKEIARMEANGIFGMLGELRSKFVFTGVYPLATLAIDKDFLREKWRRTHPAFAGAASDE